MEEDEEDSEENKEIQEELILKKDTSKKYKKLAQNLSRYSTITKEMVIKILYKTPKLRTDVENRIVADYLSKNIEYFSTIKENSQDRFLKLIAILNLEHYLPGNIIMDLYFEEDKFFIVFDGLIQVFRQYFYQKEMTLGNFLNYLNYYKFKDEKRYNRIIEQNKNMGINFKNIKENINYEQFEHKLFIFTLEEQEEVGQYTSGYVFGEMNLMRKKKKSIIVKSIGKTEVISVSKFDYNRILKTYEEKRLELLSEKFKKKFPTFKIWSMEQLITLFNYFSKVVFLKDEYIYKQNEPSDYIYFIEKGKFEQYANTNYFWYKNYIEYIGDIKHNLINLLLNKNIENVKALRAMYNEELKYQEKNDNLIKNNKIDNLLFLNLEASSDLDCEKNLEKYVKADNLYNIKKEEEDLNDPNSMIRIPILTSEMPKIIGVEEPFEFKRRFTSVKCVSGKVVAQRIKVYDLLKLLYIFKEFKYSEKFLHVLAQRKLVLITIIKNQMKLNSLKFKKEMDYKYNNLITQNKDFDKKFVAVKLKGWNNGIYLDNVLDTNLYLFKPNTERIINKEREKRYQIVKKLSENKQDKNKKKLNITYQKNISNKSKFFQLTDREENLSPRIERKNSIKRGKTNEKKYRNLKLQKHKLVSFLKDIESNASPKKSKYNNKALINKDKIVTEINSKIKDFTKRKDLRKFNLTKIFTNFNIKEESKIKIDKNNKKNLKLNDNIFAFTRPAEPKNINNKNRENNNFKYLMNIIENEYNHKKYKADTIDKKAFPALFSKKKRSLEE